MESGFLRFIAYMDILQLRSQTIKVYVSSLDHHCGLYGWDRSISFHRVRLLLRSVSMKDSPSQGKLPITLDILNVMKPVVLNDFKDGVMFWAAMVVAHFGLLRVSEFTVDTSFDISSHLSGKSVTLDNDRISVFVPRSKTDQSGKGFFLSFKCNATSVCPYCALRTYFVHNFSGRNLSAPLFSLSSGKPLSRAIFVKKTKDVLHYLGFDRRFYSSHSFRAGGATSAAMSGLKDWELKILGRWKSNCYQCYIRPPAEVVDELRNKISKDFIARDSYDFRW